MNLQSKKWIISYTLLVISSTATSLQIVVQFDGSLRPPYDFGAPTSTLGKMAACACTISRSTSDIDNPILLATGGKLLKAMVKSTSGEVEYEGLLFALKSLRTYLAKQSSSAIESMASITISGDCKTVIDQMNGKSNSRKLEMFYSRALLEADDIMHEYFLHDPQKRLRYQHTPRSNNIICDKISESLIIHQQVGVFHEVCSDLLHYEKSDECAEDLLEILDIWFLHQKSLVPLSRRPSLYRYIAEVVLERKQYNSLLDIGRRYENDVKILDRTWFKTKQTPSDDTVTNRASILCNFRAEAISYQILSLQGLGQNKKAERLKTKYDFLLNRCSSAVRDIEKLDGPRQTAISLLKSEIADVDRILLQNQMDWPLPVKQWCEELIALRNHLKEHQEIFIVRQCL
jgi:ribonuclease HI